MQLLKDELTKTCDFMFIFIIKSGVHMKLVIAFALALITNFAFADADTQRKIEMTCGKMKAEIICGYNNKSSELDDRVCSQNILIFKMPHRTLQPSIPKLHDPGSTPISLYCERGNDRKLYLSVGYLSGSYCCAKCHLTEIFDTMGGRISEQTSFGKIILEKNLKANSAFNIEGRSGFSCNSKAKEK